MQAPAEWEALFDAWVELPPAERAERLRELGERDPALAARLTALFAADEDAPTFLSSATEAPGAPPPAPAPSEGEMSGALSAGTRIGAWRLLGPIGRGGMGEVYLADRADGAFTQRAALKLTRRSSGARGVVHRFLRERQILAGLDHPNIARLLDGGTAPDGRPYFVLEWVEGLPITDYCVRHSLRVEDSLRLVIDACEAVDAAHRRLVVHRDLKPGNILVTADGVVKLLDFGIAKLLTPEEGEGSNMTRLEERALTPAYAAPEQIRGEPVTVASDVYALGVLLFELLTGELPHRRAGGSIETLVRALDTEQPERPSVVLRRRLARDAATGPQSLPRNSGDLDLIVLQALHRDPDRRYRSAAALADDLRRLLDGEPILARRHELGYRTRKFVGRNRWTVTAAAVGLVALLVGLGAALWQAESARQAARRADLASARADRVKSFLVSIFRESDPMVTGGADATARELLARGAARVDVELAQEPEAHADLLEAIAGIEASRGVLDPALEHARHALAIRLSLRPPDRVQVAQSRLLLGEVLLHRGALDEARLQIEAALSVLINEAGPHDVRVATAQRDLAESFHKPEEFARAVDLLEAAERTFLKAEGERSLEVALTREDLGMALEETERYPEAERAYRQALGSLLAMLGAHHPQVAEAQANLAGLLDRLGRTDEALQLLRAAIEIERTSLGSRHEKLASTLFSYGVLELGRTDYAAATAALREALGIFGADRFEGGHCLRYLGRAAAGEERWADAVGLYTRAAEVYARTLGPDDLQRHRTMANLGWAHYKLGKLDTGLAELGHAVERIDALGGAESYEVRMPLQQLAQVQLAAGDGTAAVATLIRVRALEHKLFGDAREVAGSDVLLARALLLRGKPGDATAARTSAEAGVALWARIQPGGPGEAEARALLERIPPEALVAAETRPN